MYEKIKEILNEKKEVDLFVSFQYLDDYGTLQDEYQDINLKFNGTDYILNDYLIIDKSKLKDILKSYSYIRIK